MMVAYGLGIAWPYATRPRYGALVGDIDERVTLMAEKPYHYIRAWGIIMGSSEGYIRFLIRLARKEKAPSTVMFRSAGKWTKFDELPTPETREKVETLVARLR